MSTTVLAANSKLYYSTNGGSTYTELAQTRDIKGGPVELGSVNITNNDSPTGPNGIGQQEMRSTLLKLGTVEYDVIYSGAGGNLLAAYNLMTTAWPGNNAIWKEAFQDGSGWHFTGYITKIDSDGKTEEGAIEGKVTIQYTSSPAFMATVC